MKWSTDRPTTTGYFWAKHQDPELGTDIVRIMTDDSGLYLVLDDRVQDMSEFTHFAGPIPEPEFP